MAVCASLALDAASEPVAMDETSLPDAAPEQSRRRRRHGWDEPSGPPFCDEAAAAAAATAGAEAAATAGVAQALLLPYRHQRTAAEVRRCRKGDLSEAEPRDWGKFGLARRDDALRDPEFVGDGASLPLPRVHRDDITPEEFFERFAFPGRPCIVEGALDRWPAMERWGLENILRDYRQTSFKVGEDDKGRKLRMKVKHFLDYMQYQQDDNPLYLFETKCEGDAQARRLLEDFGVPDLFPHDFFDLVAPQSKPPFRWWSIGPRRSGTTVHADPLGTSAWNAVTHGRKRWVLFEPAVPAKVAKGKGLVDKATEDDEAVMYFAYILPRIKAKHPDVRVYEAVQGPGDVIFVPSDWWHGVLNLEDTVAVTQNYVGLDNFDIVWVRARKERRKLAHLWLRNMRKFAPQLHDRALSLNARDCYRMRHERGPDEPLSPGGSSSSESSSDSSSEGEADLCFDRVRPAGVAIVPPWLRTSHPAAPSPPMPLSSPPAPPAEGPLPPLPVDASPTSAGLMPLATTPPATAAPLSRKRPLQSLACAAQSPSELLAC